MKKLRFDKSCDLYEVDQFGFIDLRSAFENGVIDGNVSFTDESYNRIPPDCVMSRPDDMFAAVRQKNYVQNTIRAAQASAKESAVNAS